MEQWRRNIYVLWLAVFISAICWTMVMPFTPLYLEQLGVSHSAELWSGIIISASAVCNMLMSPVWGAVGDRYGRRLMMLRAGLFLAVGYVLTALVTGPNSLLLVRMLIGGLTGFVPMAIALVGVSTPQQEVGKALGLVQTAWPAGAIIGPVVGGAAADWIGIRGSAWASAVMIAVVTAMVMLMVKEEFAPPPANRQNILADLKVAASHQVLMVIVLITAASQASIMALEPVLVPFVKQIAGVNAPGWLSGLLFSIPGVAFVLMTPWWSRRGAKIGYVQTIATGMLGSGLLYLCQTFVTGPWQLGGLRLVSGVAGAAIGPGVAVLLATAVPRELRGRAFGLNQAASSLGSVVGPLLGGFIGSYIATRGVFVLTAVIYFAGWVWVKRVVEPRVQMAAAS
ncbi:MAG: putative multidrug efflux protein [Firmicutes bacterium]|nr:putative multidrug efflux protein [Bacillota bacterium]